MNQVTTPCLGWRVTDTTQKCIWEEQEGQECVLFASLQGHPGPPTDRHYSSLWHKLSLLFTSSYRQKNQMIETKLRCISWLRNSKNIPKWQTYQYITCALLWALLCCRGSTGQSHWWEATCCLSIHSYIDNSTIKACLQSLQKMQL